MSPELEDVVKKLREAGAKYCEKNGAWNLLHTNHEAAKRLAQFSVEETGITELDFFYLIRELNAILVLKSYRKGSLEEEIKKVLINNKVRPYDINLNEPLVTGLHKFLIVMEEEINFRHAANKLHT